MDIGRAVLGASAAGALVLAAGFGVVVAQGDTLTTTARGGGICGTFPDGSTTAAAWFLAPFQNDTDHAVQVREIIPKDLHRVSLSRLAIAPHPREDTPGLYVGDDAAMPKDYGRTVPVDSGFVVPAHGQLNVVGRIVLDDGADAGRLHGLAVTSTGLLGAVHTVVDRSSYGIGIGEGHAESDIGCVGA